MQDRTKKILFIIFFVNIALASLALIYFLSRDKAEPLVSEQVGNKAVESNDVNKCYSSKLKFEPNQFIKAKIALAYEEEEDKLYEVKKTYSYVDKNKFSFKELEGLSYGFQITNSPNGYYIDYEICDLATNKTLSYPKLLKRKFYDRDRQFSSTTWQDGLQTNFSWISVDDIIRLPMEETGRYAIDVYATGKEGDWSWVDRLEFDVL